MTANQIDTSAILNALTAIAALSAVILATLSERRAQRRFKQSNEIQERIAAANIKPLLDMHPIVGPDERRVVLHNHGVGSAVIRKIIFTKGKRSGNSIPSILVLENVKEFQWDYFERFAEGATYLRGGDHLNLLILSGTSLKGDGLTHASIDEIFKKLKNAIVGTKISIEFEDVLGNKQPNYEYTIDE
jgi:hypothetical protein